MVWIGIQGSTYITVDADSQEEAKTLAQEKAEKEINNIPVDVFTGEAEEL